MAQDLRAILDLVKRRKPGGLPDRLAARSIPAYEITALVVKLEREGSRRPVLLFENVKGTPVPGAHQPAREPLAPGRGHERGARATCSATYLRAMDKPDPAARGRERAREGRRARRGDRRRPLRPAPDRPPRGRRRAPTSPPPSRSRKDPTSETWNCAYNRLMIKGRDTHLDPPDAGQAPLGVPAHRRGARRAAAGGLRHRRAPGHRARRARHRLHRRGRARHHGRRSSASRSSW